MIRFKMQFVHSHWLIYLNTGPKHPQTALRSSFARKAKMNGIWKNAIKMHSQETPKNKSKQQVHRRQANIPSHRKTSPRHAQMTLPSRTKLILPKQAIASCLVRLQALTILRDIANLNLFLNFDGRYGGGRFLELPSQWRSDGWRRGMRAGGVWIAVRFFLSIILKCQRDRWWTGQTSKPQSSSPLTCSTPTAATPLDFPTAPQTRNQWDFVEMRRIPADRDYSARKTR